MKNQSDNPSKTLGLVLSTATVTGIFFLFSGCVSQDTPTHQKPPSPKDVSIATNNATKQCNTFVDVWRGTMREHISSIIAIEDKFKEMRFRSSTTDKVTPSPFAVSAFISRAGRELNGIKVSLGRPECTLTDRDYRSLYSGSLESGDALAAKNLSDAYGAMLNMQAHKAALASALSSPQYLKAQIAYAQSLAGRGAIVFGGVGDRVFAVGEIPSIKTSPYLKNYFSAKGQAPKGHTP